MFTEMRVISVFAVISSIFFLLGTCVIMQYAIRQPTKWASLPVSGTFAGTIMFIGISMYSFEGQTMVFNISTAFPIYHSWNVARKTRKLLKFAFTKWEL